MPSGRLAVTGGTQLPHEVEPVHLAPGGYRVRIAYAQTDYRPPGSTDSEPGDHVEYQVTLWPALAGGAVTVLKQGPSPWAY